MIPEKKIFARYPSGAEGKKLQALCRSLVDDQKNVWPACANGFASLGKAEMRTLVAGGFTTHLQWNPQRLVSTGAKVDAESIKARKCFLCVENLPEEQQGILYRDEYMLLCNPSPIFSEHYTVAHVEHTPQDIGASIRALLMLSQDIGEEYVGFYNGPKCGASAPDHLHFQIVPSGAIPAEGDVKNETKKDILKERNGITVWKIPFYGRTHCILTGSDIDALTDAFHDFVSAWKKIQGQDAEPMINLLTIVQDGSLSLLLFLRRKHRPDDYFKDGEDRVLVSPASVDMGGHVVTPVEKDYHALDGPYIERLYQEVGEDPNIVIDIIHAL